MTTNPTYAPLTLDRVHVRGITVPLRRPIVSKVGVWSRWPCILVDVYTREGVVGRSYIESYLPTAPPYVAAVIHDIADRFKDKPLAPFDWSRDALAEMQALGRQGVMQVAVSALDMAIWDARARAAGLPLAVMLGGSTGKLRAYNTCGLWLVPIDRLADEAQELVAEGSFKAIKIRLGRPSLKEDLAAIRAVRRAVGDEIHVMCDFNQGMALGEALHRLRALDDEGIYWFEEPIVYDNLAGCAQIAREMRTPVQIGENIYGPRTFLDAIRAGAADLYAPDLMRIGGVTGWIRAAAIAGAAGMPLSNHLHTPLAAQLLRATDSYDWLEWSDWANPFLAEPFLVKDGYATVPDRPGNGLEWDEAAVKRFEGGAT